VVAAQRLSQNAGLIGMRVRQNWRNSDNHTSKIRVLLVLEARLEEIANGELHEGDLAFQSGAMSCARGHASLLPER
jgi:hypothetical protein